jgi:3-deoxy-D-manno-octulosonic-acid transferase
MLLIYRLIFFLIIIIGSPYLLVKGIWGKHGVRERLGMIPVRKSNGRLFWLHAASVGELKVLSSVVPELRSLVPGVEIAVSTTTATGKRRASQLFGDSALTFIQPLEVNSAILRVIENLRPEKLILVETELWPLLINTAADCGVEVDLINARLSRRSFKIYSWFGTLMAKTVSRLTNLLTQSEDDTRRFVALGAYQARTLGNTKFDQVFLESRNMKPAISRPPYGRLVFVAGSVRRGEDRIFAEVIRRVRDRGLPVSFVLVPRHMKDIDDLCGDLENHDIGYRLWSKTDAQTVDFDRVLVVDTMGDLPGFYRAADLAFVGGSLVPIGGHDPAEPAALGLPILFGPHMQNASVAARLLLDCGAACEVRNANDIVCQIESAIGNRETLEHRGRLGRDAIASMAGVSAKIAHIIAGIPR